MLARMSLLILPGHPRSARPSPESLSTVQVPELLRGYVSRLRQARRTYLYPLASVIR